MAEKTTSSTQDAPLVAEPMPIWFFVGVILAVYGVLVLLGQIVNTRETVLGSMQPGYWWGGIMVVFGAVFTLIGIVSHRKAG